MEFTGIYACVLLIYIVGIFVSVAEETYKETEFHGDGFLGIPCSTDSYRKVTGKDLRKALVWPILLLPWLVKYCVWMLNELLVLVLLIFNYDYRKSNVYKFINDIFD